MLKASQTTNRFSAAALALSLVLFPMQAKAQMLESYQAFLGPSDLFNSQGQRLTQPWQIIRQDRANFHRFGVRDPGDESDSFFATASNRALMERMILNGFIDPGAASQIVNGNVWIRVDIFPDSVNVTVN